MLLSPADLAALSEEIRLLHIGYVTKHIGADVAGLTPEIWQQLRDGGYVTASQAEDFVLAAYRFGHTRAWHQTTGAALSSGAVASIFAAAKQAGMPDLSPVQREAVAYARERAGSYIVGLGNRIAADFTTLAIETEGAVRQDLKTTIGTEVVTAIVNRETVRKLASRLGDATGDWSRNLERIASTELENAHQAGWAGYIGGEFGAKARVAKIPNPDACKTCRRLYLVRGGKPRIFTLDELNANGSNFGRKQADYLPVVGTVHPLCFPAGTLVSTPNGRVAIESVLPGDEVWAPGGTVERTEGVWVSEYHGDLVRLVGDGWALPCTPNHKILTSRGEVEAQFLVPGDDLIGEIGDCAGEIAAPDANAHQDPSIRVQGRRFAVVLSGFSRGGVPISAVYFDGELHVGEGEIDKEGAETMAWHRVETSRLECLEHGPLGIGFDRTLLTGDHSFDLLNRHFATTCRVMGRSDERVATILIQAGPSAGLTAGPVALDKSGIADRGDDERPLQTKTTGDRKHRDSVVKVPAKYIGGDSVALAAASDEQGVGDGANGSSITTQACADRRPVHTERSGDAFHRALFIEVHPAGGDLVINCDGSTWHEATVPRVRRLVNARRFAFCGLVYNLQVSNVHQYIANGIGVANCHCTLIHVPLGFDLDADGSLVPAEEAA